MPASDGGLSPVGPALARAAPLTALRPLLVASDFDGTLAMLDPDPWRARMLPAARRALRRLASTRDVRVALISGRTVADLAARARVGSITYLGDHGVERADAARGFRVRRLRVHVEPASDEAVATASRLARDLPRALAEPWLVVEHKSASVAFHFRAAADLAAARASVRAAVDELDPEGRLERHQGRRVLELRPSGASTKAAALRRLLEEHQPRAALMIGDDRHDAQAFGVLRAARRGGRLVGLAVAVAGHPDTTPDVAPHADLTLPSPTDAARFLAGLAHRVATDGP